MSTINDSDFVLVKRGSTHYKAEAGTLASKIQDTDTLLVKRGGSHYQVAASDVNSKVQDTDECLIQRGSTAYKVTGAVFKALFGQTWGIAFDPELIFDVHDLAGGDSGEVYAVGKRSGGTGGYYYDAFVLRIDSDGTLAWFKNVQLSDAGDFSEEVEYAVHCEFINSRLQVGYIWDGKAHVDNFSPNGVAYNQQQMDRYSYVNDIIQGGGVGSNISSIVVAQWNGKTTTYELTGPTLDADVSSQNAVLFEGTNEAKGAATLRKEGSSELPIFITGKSAVPNTAYLFKVAAGGLSLNYAKHITQTGYDQGFNMHSHDVVLSNGDPVVLFSWDKGWYQKIALVKYDQNGNVTWFRRPHGTFLKSYVQYYTTCLASDNDGNIYALYRVATGTTTNTTWGAYLQKFNSSGTVQWTKWIRRQDGEMPGAVNSVAVTKQGMLVFAFDHHIMQVTTDGNWANGTASSPSYVNHGDGIYFVEVNPSISTSTHSHLQLSDGLANYSVSSYDLNGEEITNIYRQGTFESYTTTTYDVPS